MIWDDVGFLLSKNRYNENSLIAELYTKNHGKVPGIIFGGTSKKIKNYLQIGNNLHINFNSKSENRIGYFKIEIQQAFSPYYFDNQKKLSCISSAMHLVRILTAESQKNENIYNLMENFYILLNKDDWIKNYIFWELKLFSLLGYNLELKKMVTRIEKNENVYYQLNSQSENRNIPNFLIENNFSANDDDLNQGLKLVGDFLEKSILKPNNLNQPISRLQFLSSLK